MVFHQAKHSQTAMKPWSYFKCDWGGIIFTNRFWTSFRRLADESLSRHTSFSNCHSNHRLPSKGLHIRMTTNWPHSTPRFRIPCRIQVILLIHNYCLIFSDCPYYWLWVSTTTWLWILIINKSPIDEYHFQHRKVLNFLHLKEILWVEMLIITLRCESQHDKLVP